MIDPVDMAIAISRMPRIDGEDNKAQLQHIQAEELRELLAFALGYTDNIKVGEGKNWLQRLFKKEGDEKEWQAVWATAARTRQPNGKFPAFETGALASFPFVIEPYRPSYQIKPNYNTSYDYKTKQNEQYLIGQELAIPMPTYQETPTPLLYAMDVYATRKNEYFYYVSEADIRYFFSLTKNYNLYYYTNGIDTAQYLATKNSSGIPKNWAVSGDGNIRFSKNGEKLFFGIAPIPRVKDTTLVDFEHAKVDVWGWQDDYLQPMQLVNLKKDRSAWSIHWLSICGKIRS